MEYAQKPTRTDAFGDLLAAAPELAELIAYRAELERDLLTDEQRDERLRARMAEQGLTFRTILADRLPEELDEMPLAEALHKAVDLLIASQPDMTVGDALTWLNDKFALDAMGLAFITARAKGERDDSIIESIGGQVKTGVFHENTDDRLPYVVAVATPKTDLKEHIAEYTRVCREHFAGIPNPTAATIDFITRCIRVRQAGRARSRGARFGPSDVTRHMWVEEHPEDAGRSHRELVKTRGAMYQARYDRVRQALTRDIDRVTETRPSRSQK